MPSFRIKNTSKNLEVSELITIFAPILLIETIYMMTKEEALRRFKAAKQTKKNAVAALEQKMKSAYEERTGLKANYVVTL